MPGSRVSPTGSAAAASACPATVSWSVRAMTSSPAATARLITSAGVVVPSETLLWLCRSARRTVLLTGDTTRRTLAGKLGARRAEREVQLLAGIAQVQDPQGLREQRPGRARPQDQPQPGAHDLTRERRPARRVDPPQGQLVAPEADRGGGRAGGGGGAPG